MSGQEFGEGLHAFSVYESDEHTIVLARDADDAVQVVLENYGYADASTETLEMELGWKGGRPEDVRLVSKPSEIIVTDLDGPDMSLDAYIAHDRHRCIVCSTAW